MSLLSVEVGASELLGRRRIVTTLSFGSVVTMPVAQMKVRTDGLLAVAVGVVLEEVGGLVLELLVGAVLWELGELVLVPLKPLVSGTVEPPTVLQVVDKDTIELLGVEVAALVDCLPLGIDVVSVGIACS